MRAKHYLAVALMALLLCAGPAMALFGQNSKTFRGRVNFVQQSNFSIMLDANEFVQIFVNPDQLVPPEVQVGVVVEVKAKRADDGLWYLKKFKKIELNPPFDTSL